MMSLPVIKISSTYVCLYLRNYFNLKYVNTKCIFFSSNCHNMTRKAGVELNMMSHFWQRKTMWMESTAREKKRRKRRLVEELGDQTGEPEEVEVIYRSDIIRIWFVTQSRMRLSVSHSAWSKFERVWLLEVIHAILQFVWIIFEKSTYCFANVENDSRNAPNWLRKTVTIPLQSWSLYIQHTINTIEIIMYISVSLEQANLKRINPTVIFMDRGGSWSTWKKLMHESPQAGIQTHDFLTARQQCYFSTGRKPEETWDKKKKSIPGINIH